MKREELRYLLINVPLTDPTASYHSIPYLVGATSNAGFHGWRCLDANIEALNCLANPEHVATALQQAAEARQTLEGRERLTRAEQLGYRYALRAVGLSPDSVQRAIAILQDKELFYDYGSYRQAAMVLRRWLDVLSLQGFPGQFGGDFTLRLNNIGNFSSLADLTNPEFITRISAPFAPYFENQFQGVLRENRWDIVGLSVNYTSQLPFAVALAKLIRRTLPDCVLCAGGTEISDDIKCLRQTSDIWHLFPDCDAIVGGEGESALLAVLDAVANERDLPRDQPGLLVREAAEHTHATTVSFENLATLPSPKYDVWDLHAYWAPEPVLLYSPTRGCYWNKCTFCDYGLNSDLPTSPSRNRPVEAVIDELRGITHLCRTMYFSVDAIAPAHLRRLAQSLVANGVAIRWSAELRLERSLLRGMAQELKDAGCVAISFGYESGSQRILDAINKGVRLEQVPELLGELARVGIAAQMMGFVGFPGETLDDARATYEFLLRHADRWTLAGIGDFILTPGAIVAKRPTDFGIQRTAAFDGDDIVRSLYWLDSEGRPHFDGGAHQPALEQLAEGVTRFVDDRPFVGGIDSAHSILYFARYGAKLVPPEQRDGLAAKPIVKAQTYATPLDGVETFTSRQDLAAFHRTHRVRGTSVGMDDVLSWLAETPEDSAVAADSSPGKVVLEIFPSGQFMRRSADLDELEQEASPAYRRLKEWLLRESGVV